MFLPGDQVVVGAPVELHEERGVGRRLDSMLHLRGDHDPEDVKRFETVNDYLFCMCAWSGLLIQATVGMWGGRGRPANRDGFASNAALKVTAR